MRNEDELSVDEAFYALMDPSNRVPGVDVLTNINSQDENGYTVLHHACIKLGYSYEEEINNNIRGVVKFLLQDDAKIDPNIKDNRGMTALHHAVDSQDLETVKLLLQTAKADPNIIDSEGCTALHYASYGDRSTNPPTPETPKDGVNEQSTLSIVEHLLIAGSNIDSVNNEGKTPLYIASENNNIKATKSLLIVTNPELFPEIFSESDDKLLFNVKEFFKKSVIEVPAKSKLEITKEESSNAIEVSSYPFSNVPPIFHFTITKEDDGKCEIKCFQTREMPHVNDGIADEAELKITGNYLKESTPPSMVRSQNLDSFAEQPQRPPMFKEEIKSEPSQMNELEPPNEKSKATPSRRTDGPRPAFNDEATKIRKSQDIITRFNPRGTGGCYFDPTTLQRAEEPRGSAIKILTPLAGAAFGPKSKNIQS